MGKVNASHSSAENEDTSKHIPINLFADSHLGLPTWKRRARFLSWDVCAPQRPVP